MRRRSGVNAIELVLIVTIVVLLAAIVLPWFLRTGRQQASYDAKSALERLRDAQDAYFAKNHAYATDAKTAGVLPPADVRVVIGGTGIATGRGWNATAANGGVTCYIGVGVDTVIGSIHTGDGHVVCP